VLFRRNSICHRVICVVQTKQQFPYSSLCCTHKTAVAIHLSVLYRQNSSCHTAFCAVWTKQQLPYSCLCCTDHPAVAIKLCVLYSTHCSCHTALCTVYIKHLTATQCSSQHIFTKLMIPSMKSQSRCTRIFYVTFIYSFSMCAFTPLQQSVA